VAAFQNHPPIWLFDGLRVETLLADALHEDRPRHLSLAEARDAHGRGEVVCRVLDGVVDIVRRDVDGQLDLVVRELFNGRIHDCRAIEPDL